MHDHSAHNAVSLRKTRIKVPIILFLCIVVSVCIGVWYVVSRVYVVEHIVCQMDQEQCSETVMAELNRFQSKPLLFLDFSIIKNKLHGAFPQLQSITFRKQFPKTLTATLTSSQESIVIYLPESSTYAFITQQGKVLNTTPIKPEKTLYISVPAKTLRQGDSLTQDELHDVIRLIQIMRENLNMYGIERISEKEIIIYLSNNTRAVVSSEGLEKQVATLQLLLNEATMIENISVMDLRFSHPVLR